MVDERSPVVDPAVERPTSRRGALASSLAAGISLALGGPAAGQEEQSSAARDPRGEATRRDLSQVVSIAPETGEDVLLRMQRELVKAMAKPVEERRWGMVIDRRKCVGCHACTVACIAENNLPPGVVYRPVSIEESGTYPAVKLHFLPRPCNQCEEPPCVPTCPVDATWKRADGVTVIDYDKCIGCEACVEVCPYHHRTMDRGAYYTASLAAGNPTGDTRPVQGGGSPYEARPNHEYRKAWQRAEEAPPVGKARKCHFCLHRLEAGQLPMCVTTCIGRATYFGDVRDPASLVSELREQYKPTVLLPERGTVPHCFYIDPD